MEKERCLIHGVGDEGVGGVDGAGAGAPAVPKTNKQSATNYLRRILCESHLSAANIIQKIKIQSYRLRWSYAERCRKELEGASGPRLEVGKDEGGLGAETTGRTRHGV